jgi:hypothetical protein
MAPPAKKIKCRILSNWKMGVGGTAFPDSQDLYMRMATQMAKPHHMKGSTWGHFLAGHGRHFTGAYHPVWRVRCRKLLCGLIAVKETHAGNIQYVAP